MRARAGESGVAIVRNDKACDPRFRVNRSDWSSIPSCACAAWATSRSAAAAL